MKEMRIEMNEVGYVDSEQFHRSECMQRKKKSSNNWETNQEEILEKWGAQVKQEMRTVLQLAEGLILFGTGVIIPVISSLFGPNYYEGVEMDQ
ncbi:hypothetical protein MHYP_G00247670 [Metynnis hypsauchen]